MTGKELYKLITSKYVLFTVAAALVLNLFVVWNAETGTNEYSPGDYAEFWNELTAEASEKGWDAVLDGYDARYELFDTAGMTVEERVALKLSSIYRLKALYEDVEKEIEFQLGYADYLCGIEAMGERYKMLELISETDSYAYRKIEKVVAAYSAMEKKALVPEQSAGVSMAAEPAVTDIIGVVMILSAAVVIWLMEREDGVLFLIRTTRRGRTRLALSKLAVMGMFAVFSCVTLYFSNAVMAAFMYGLGSFYRPLASVYDFGRTMWQISVGEFLLLNVLFKTVAYVWVAFLISAVCCLVKKIIPACALVVSVAGAGCLMFYKIPFLSGYAAFKFLNPFAILKTELLFKEYMAFDFFGYPTDYRLCMAVVLSAGIIIFAASAMYFFAHCTMKEKGAHPGVFSKIYVRIRKCSGVFERHTNVLLHELHRLIFLSGTGVVLIVFLGFVFYDSMPYTVKYSSGAEYVLRSYLENLAGPLTEEKKDYIEEEWTRVRKASDDWSKIQKEALISLQGSVQYIEQNEGAYLLYDVPHGIITAADGNTKDLINYLICMITVTLVMPCFFTPDYRSGMNRISAVTRFGKRRLGIMRYVTGGVLAALVACTVHVAYFMQVIRSYDVSMDTFTYPVNSITEFYRMGSDMSLAEYCFAAYFLKITFVIIASVLMLYVSKLLKSQIYATMAAFLLFPVPAAAVLYDGRTEAVIYPYSAALGNLFMQNKTAAAVCVTAVAAVAVCITVKQVCDRRKRMYSL